MSDPRDKEPDLGRVEDVDDSTTNVAPLRTEGSDPDPEPSFSAAHGLTTRDRPAEAEAETPGGENEPGASLRRAREAAGLDTATLASRIHLGRGTLEDLEANRFHHMPPAYVRGYLRSCARELGVDAGPWIQSFEQHGLVDPELQAVATPSARARRRRRSRGIYWLALLLLVALLGLGVYAWNERTGALGLPSINLGDAREAVQGLADPALTDEEPAVVPDGEAAPPEALPTEGGAEDSAAAEAAEAEPIESGESTPDTGIEDGQTLAITPESLTERVAVPEEPVTPEVASEIASLPEAEAPAETSPAPADTAGGAELVLEFSETSWVEIRDAADEVVLTGVLSSGDRETLRLELPGRVILGNAEGVSLTLDGTPVDLEPHIRSDRTARFDLEG
ncbi:MULTISPECIES: helix-turn-helix domain-containing protein [unclassified Thioalkalivibrio]|uniref:helix-turn-helix domain-containing protein n=1 Tax=unclassified Thioalkalivibrio TaxID=2621013 RepID=UPI00036FD5FD|nr:MULTISPECIES: helix-turn-helix domain-containing protein [unclassified Thioalkalivibrio]